MYNSVTKITEIKYYKPIEKIDNLYIINFDKTDILAEECKNIKGSWEKTGNIISTENCRHSSFATKKEMTPAEIVNTINEIIDSETAFIITNSFFWNGYNVYLSKENQMNYKNAFDLAVATNGESLPITFKFKKNGKSEYYTFDTVVELKDFYLKVNKHINDCLQDGWKRKDKVNIEDYKI